MARKPKDDSSLQDVSHSFDDGQSENEKPAVKPNTIGARIRHLRRRMRLNQKDFAALINVSQAALSRWERLDDTPSDVYVRKIAEISGSTPSYVRYGDEFDAEVDIPVVGYVGAGHRVILVGGTPSTEQIDTVKGPPSLPIDAQAVIVKGSSMWPEFDDGDILIFRRDQPFDESACLNKRCVVLLPDGQAFVKRLMRSAMFGRYTLVSGNAPPIEDVEIEWAGPVTMVLS